ncbi:MAG: peptidylprolyl isomerase [Planctomycetota bacterium]|nr:peptidylprolyl isomerase [Planctomycetota bacterium]
MKEAGVKVYTNRGSFEIKLFPKDATGTCNNFVRLIHKNFYNGLIFHRIIKDFMIQGGCPRGTGTGGPGYNILGEITGKRHNPGRVAMAHSGNKDSGGCQFYICTGEAQGLNQKHSVFGEVVKGMDVVNVHGKTKTNLRNNKPAVPQRIRRMVLVP